jgi:uncharacterized membrane protein
MAGDDELQLHAFGEAGGEDVSVAEEVERRAPRRSVLIRRAGWLLARPSVFLVLLALHVAWVLLNLRPIAWYPPWDPYPFTFLATIASALAPFVSLLILMRQQRDAHVAELREEVSLQVDLYNQRQLAATVRMLSRLSERLDVPTGVTAESLEHLARPLQPQRLMESVRRRLDKAEHESHE